MKYRISQLLCNLLAHSREGLQSALVLACSTLIFSPVIAQAELSDISRIFHQTPTLSQFEICQGGGCVVASKISLTETEWDAITRIFNAPTKSAQEKSEVVERKKIAQAIGVLEDIVGQKIGTSADLAGTFFDGKLAGQQDCNDEAINTTTYMRLLKQNNLMLLHEIEDMRTRNFFFTGWPHSTAVIREIKTGERYAVDSWFYENGHAATIVTFKQWKANFQPEDSPINRPNSGLKARNQNSVTDLTPVSR